MPKKPTVLICIGHYLPGYKIGGPLTSIVTMVDRLSPYYDFKIITSDRDFGDDQPYPNVEFNKWVKVNSAEVYYVPRNHLLVKNVYKVLKNSPYDVLYLNPLLDPRFSIYPLLLYKLGLIHPKKVIVAPRGELFDEALSFKPFKKSIFLNIAKLTRFYKNITWHATDARENKFIQSKLSIRPDRIKEAMVLSNIEFLASSVQNKSDTLKIIFLGRISKDKNLPYAFRVLQKVKHPVVFDIYGNMEDEYIWEECKSIVLPENIKMTYRGFLERDKVKQTLIQYDLMFLPTFAENFGHVIAESLSCGVPVLISDNTPWRDLESKGWGWDINLSKEEKFVEVINKLSGYTYEQKVKMRNDIIDSAKKELSNQKVIESYIKLFAVDEA